MKIKYFEKGSGFIAVTDECPKGFKGVLYVGKEGTLDNIVEAAFEAGQLRKLRSVALSEVPAEWVLAFGYEKPPKPAPKPEPEPEVEAEEPEVFDVILDEEGENVIDVAPRPRRRPAAPVVVAAAGNGRDIWFYAGVAIAAVAVFGYLLTR